MVNDPLAEARALGERAMVDLEAMETIARNLFQDLGSEAGASALTVTQGLRGFLNSMLGGLESGLSDTRKAIDRLRP